MANGNLGDAMLLPDGSQYEGTDIDFRAVSWASAGSRTPVDFVEWKLPGYGIARVAIEVDDLDAAGSRVVHVGVYRWGYT
jgi:hypothetical protein